MKCYLCDEQINEEDAVALFPNAEGDFSLCHVECPINEEEK